MFTLINFLFFSINIFVKIVSRVFIFGVLAYSSFFIFFVIILISFSLLESTVSLVESEYTFFMNSLFIYITIMSVYLIFDYFKPFLAKIIKKIKIELNNNINIVTLMQKQEQEYENEVMKDKLLIKGLLKGIFNSILSTFKLIFIICLILTPFLLVFIILGGISFMMGSFNESNIFLEILMIIFKHIGFTILFKYFFYLIKIPIVFIIILVAFPIILVLLLIKPNLAMNTILKIKNKVNDFKNIMLTSELKNKEEMNELIEQYIIFSLSNLLVWLFSGVISFGIYDYLANRNYIYNLYVALFIHFLIVGIWAIFWEKEGW